MLDDAYNQSCEEVFLRDKILLANDSPSTLHTRSLSLYVLNWNLRCATTTLWAALDEQVGADAFLHVFIAAGETLHRVTAQALGSTGAKSFGFDDSAVAAKAGNLAALSFLLVGCHAAAPRLGVHRKAACMADTKAIARFFVAKLHVLAITGRVGTTKATIHASSTVSHDD